MRPAAAGMKRMGYVALSKERRAKPVFPKRVDMGAAVAFVTTLALDERRCMQKKECHHQGVRGLRDVGWREAGMVCVESRCT